MAIAEFWEYPPYPFLQQVLHHCPKAALTYWHLWKQKDKNNNVSMTNKDVSYFKHPNAFKSDLRQLNIEGLISYDEDGGKISIEMVDWESFDTED